MVLISRQSHSSEYTVGWRRRQDNWKMKPCPGGIGGVAEMGYFQSTANEKDNVIKLNQVAYLYTLKVSLKSKACQTVYKMTLIS